MGLSNKMFSRLTLLLLLLLAMGCTTARNREGQTNLLDSYDFKSGKIEEAFNERFRTSTLYLDNGMVLEVDALFCDLSYRSFYQGEMARLYFYDSDQKAATWSKEQEEYENFYTFIAVIYSGASKAPDFGRPSSQWQAFLKDDEGDLLHPNKVVHISRKDSVALFLDKYFRPLDNWGEIYLIQFPKLHRPMPQGNRPVQLILTGLKGQALLKWDNLGLFTQERDRFFLE